MEIPMLNEGEYAIDYKLYGKGFQNRKGGVKRDLCFKELLDYYKDVTGFEETEPNAIMHHRIAYYWANCPKCNKSLRTKKARYCVECGFGKEDFLNQETKPLMERRKNLFKD